MPRSSSRRPSARSRQHSVAPRPTTTISSDWCRRVVGRHGLDDADDIAAVLRYRVDKLAATPPRGCRLKPRLIAGLIPEPLGEMSAEDRQAIDERKRLIESRALTLAEEAFAGRQAWARRFGPRPCDAGNGEAWLDAAATVAAYRDRYKIISDLPVGGRAKNDAQRADRHRALTALRAAGSAVGPERATPSPSMEVPAISTP